MVEFEDRVSSAIIKGYLHERIDDDKPYPRAAVLILPGGAYEHLSKREGEPVALKFLSQGYQAFVLEYTVGRENIEKHEPEWEVAEALSYLRAKSTEYDIIPDKIALLGFSAGAHLALSSQCHIKSSRADALILSYPVVTTGPYGHERSTYNITGGDEEKKRYYSLENEVTDNLPPLFVWHTAEDESVSPMNSVLLVEALIREGADYECHIFEKGGHGLSICTNDVMSPMERTSKWLNLVFSWLEEVFCYRQ